MEIFISHTESDEKTARKLADKLVRLGFRVWNPERDMYPGDNIAKEISEAIERSEAMVLLLSADWERSHWVRRQMQYAFGCIRYKNRLGYRRKERPRETPASFEQLPLVSLGKVSVEEAAQFVAERLREPAAE